MHLDTAVAINKQNHILAVSFCSGSVPAPHAYLLIPIATR